MPLLIGCHMLHLQLETHRILHNLTKILQQIRRHLQQLLSHLSKILPIPPDFI